MSDCEASANNFLNWHFLIMIEGVIIEKLYIYPLGVFGKLTAIAHAQCINIVASVIKIRQGLRKDLIY